MTKLCTLSLLAALVAVSAPMAAPQAVKILGRSSTTKSFGSASAWVYLRDDPDYKRDLQSQQADLREAQAALREAQESIATGFKLTPRQRQEQQRFLAPFVQDVKDAKADLAELARDYTRPYRAYGFRVQASSSQTVMLEWTLRCSKGGVENTQDGALTKLAPFELWRPPTLRRAHSCYLVAYTSRNAGGRLTTTLLGRR